MGTPLDRVPMKTNVRHPYIVSKRGVCGGSPIIKGTRIPVWAIVGYYRDLQYSVEEIAAQLPGVTPAQIHDALSFYYDHYVILYNRWLERGWEHAGTIVSRQISIGEALRRLDHLMRARTSQDNEKPSGIPEQLGVLEFGDEREPQGLFFFRLLTLTLSAIGIECAVSLDEAKRRNNEKISGENG